MMRSYMGRVFAPQRFFTTLTPILPVSLRQTNEELSKLITTTDSDSSSERGLVNDVASDPLDQPQFPGSDPYDPWFNPVYNHSMHDDILDQAPKKAASGMVIAPQSFITTFPPFPISLGQTNGGSEFEAMTNNFKQYELWDPPQESNNQTANSVDGLWDHPQENNNEGDAHTINDGSFYMISRKPFEPIGRPYNPFGPIARPVTPSFI
ncbi:hypothetical protein EUTSA_v10026255mg [Eutrema salsugineum]|uniref:Uncharacterized protein n=1 Tax=Eutrema salsugineum TaxID=72664 RepID=V4MG07_EUTSA|nr:hypothetical protein EUTSA_v10026255mg [Eutrema salsugineum]